VKTDFRQSFLDDVNDVSDRNLRRRVKDIIVRVEEAPSLHDVPNLKKLHGSKGHYRIRIGNHRVGISLRGDTVVFVRFLPRRDIYRYFP